MKSLKEILVQRDGISASEADKLIQKAKDDLKDCLISGNFTRAENICEIHFNLEPDFLMELI